MITKILVNSFLISLLCLTTACGLKVGNVDVGRLASAGADVVTGGKLSLKEQQNIGQQMAAIIVGSSQLHQDDELQRYVNRVGQWVASHSAVKSTKKNPFQWQFMVIDTPDFNAFSMPGGYVVVSSGAIDRLSSEAELAAVLAHEIVHVEQNHQVKAIEKSKTLSGVGDIAFITADYQKSKEGGYSRNAAKNRQLAEGLFDVTFNLYTKGLGRDDELDADQKAVVLMTRAGYDPYAYVAVMQIIDSIDDKEKLLMLATHPKTEDRITVALESIKYVEKYVVNTRQVSERFLLAVK